MKPICIWLCSGAQELEELLEEIGPTAASEERYGGLQGLYYQSFGNSTLTIFAMTSAFCRARRWSAEAQKQKPGYNIIRRRIAIVISQWITIKVAESVKPTVYQIYQHLLDKNDPLNDQVVRVTAGRRFNEVANEWEFKADNFLPYAPVILDRLMALVQEVELPETKMALLNTISVVVERMEHNVSLSSMS